MYRDGYEAARAALEEETGRLRARAEKLEEHRPELPAGLLRELDELRGQLEPADTTLDAVQAAQAAAERYARKLRSATDLASQLRGERTRRAAMPFWRKVAVDARAIPWGQASLIGLPLLAVVALVVILGPAAALSAAGEDTDRCLAQWEADPSIDVADCEGRAKLVLPWLLPWAHDEAVDTGARTAERVALARLDHTTAAVPDAAARGEAAAHWLSLGTTSEEALLDRGISLPRPDAAGAVAVTAARVRAAAEVPARGGAEAVAMRCFQGPHREVPPGTIAGYPARWALHWACGWSGPEPVAPSARAWARLELRRYADLAYAKGRRKALATALRTAGAPALPLAARVMGDPAWTDAERAGWLEGLDGRLSASERPWELLVDADAWADPGVYLAAAAAAPRLPLAAERRAWWEATWLVQAALAHLRAQPGATQAAELAKTTLRRAASTVPDDEAWLLAGAFVAVGAAERGLALLDAAPATDPRVVAVTRAHALLALRRPADAQEAAARALALRPNHEDVSGRSLLWLRMAALSLAGERLSGFGEAPAEFPGLPSDYGATAVPAWARALGQGPAERRWQRLQVPPLVAGNEPFAAPVAVLAAKLAAGEDDEVFLDRVFARLVQHRPIVAVMARRAAAGWRDDDAAVREADAIARRMSAGTDERRAWLATLLGWR